MFGIGIKNMKRRGTVIILTALMLVVIMAMAACAVDLGWVALVRNQLQVAADAAAMAAAGEMNGSQTTASAKAKAIAGLNRAGGPNEFVTLADSDIVYGVWDPVGKTFTANSSNANAIKVTARKTLTLFL